MQNETIGRWADGKIESVQRDIHDQFLARCSIAVNVVGATMGQSGWQNLMTT